MKSSAESWKVRVGGFGCFHAEKRRYKTVLEGSERLNWLGKLRVLRAPSDTT